VAAEAILAWVNQSLAKLEPLQYRDRAEKSEAAVGVTIPLGVGVL
jgi:hypothetical protein